MKHVPAPHRRPTRVAIGAHHRVHDSPRLDHRRVATQLAREAAHAPLSGVARPPALPPRSTPRLRIRRGVEPERVAHDPTTGRALHRTMARSPKKECHNMARLVSAPVRPTTRNKVIGAGIAGVVILLIVLAAAGVFSSGSNNVGTVSAGAAPSTSTGSSSSPTAQRYPFGKPSNKADYVVPSPPGEA